MIAGTHKTNGHAPGSAPLDIIDRLVELDRAHFERRQEREAASTYTAGTSDRMNPVPKGVDPLGTDADYHYRTERNYRPDIAECGCEFEGSTGRKTGKLDSACSFDRTDV